MSALVLVRHGQSQWNLENRFTGWTDVPLTDRGREDASRCGGALKEFHFDRAFTSRLQRAADTLAAIVHALNRDDIPVMPDSALNERHYGDLQGLNKAETVAKHGEEQVQLWRRDFFTRPPNGESMEDCERRTLPFFLQYVLPHVHAGETILIAAHGNSLRPIVKYLDTLDPATAASMEIGLCTPYIYTFDGKALTGREVREVPGVFTKGASLTEKKTAA